MSLPKIHTDIHPNNKWNSKEMNSDDNAANMQSSCPHKSITSLGD